MKKVKLQLMLMVITILFSARMSAQNLADTIKEKTSILNDKINGLDERLLETESTVNGLKKIKVGGYIQSEYQRSEYELSPVRDNFLIRRARLKTTYDPGTGPRYVLESDFTPAGFTIKDCYAVMNDPWVKEFSLTAGYFTGLDYEIEYSSGMREVPEYAKITQAIYPSERDLGFKLEYTPHKVPIKIQLALLNGNSNFTFKGDPSGTNVNPANKDFDNFKNFAARAIYSLKFGSFGGLDFGANAYMGKLKGNSTENLNSDYAFNKSTNMNDYLDRRWVGGEFQLYADILGGMSLKGEYISGVNPTPGYVTTVETKTTTTTATPDGTTPSIVDLTNNTTDLFLKTIQPSQSKNFSGYYLYLIKAIGKKNQFAFRYDVYDPNIKISGNQITSTTAYTGATSYDKQPTVKTDTKGSIANLINVSNNTTTINQTAINSATSGLSDIKYSTLVFAWNYFFNENLRVTLAYAIPINEKGKAGKDSKGNPLVSDKATINNATTYVDYSNLVHQNLLTLRIQAKF